MDEKTRREKQGTFTALAGFLLNLILGISKIAAGFITSSVAIISDGVNNLSDSGTGLMAVLSFKMAGKKADREHPYGHGRFEYIAAFIIAAVIITAGAELLKSSVKDIVKGGAAVSFSAAAVTVLAVSAVIKLFMFVFYRIYGRKLDSDVLKVSGLDALTDIIVTAAVCAGYILSAATDIAFPFDSVTGAAASFYILTAGVVSVIKTVNKLIGRGGDSELTAQLKDLAMYEPEVLGVHDIKIHDYGPEFKVASMDAEFDKNMSFIDVHRVAARIESRAFSKLSVHLVVHTDPIDKNDKRLNAIKDAITKVLALYQHSSIHDLSVNDEEKTVDFHLCLIESMMKEKEHIMAEIMEAVWDILPGYVVQAEFDFV